MRGRRTVREGKGMLSRKPAAFIQVGCALAAILLFLDIVALESDLRNGLVPVAAGLLALSTAGVTMLAALENIGRPRRLARAAAVVAALGLTGIACFFASLAVLSLIGSSLLDADTPLAAAGTLVASMLVFVSFGVCLVRDRTLPAALRVMPWVLVATVLGGGLLAAWAPEGPGRWVELGWFVALAILVSWFAVLVTSRIRGTGAAPPLAY
jgi:hypothetical protein